MNFCVIGLGWPGHMHSAAIEKTPSARLYSLVEANEDRLAAFLKKHPAPHTHSDIATALADPEVDAVVVALPNALHFPVSLAALKAGKHVLCEKPPTMHAGEMRKLKAEAEKRGLVYAFGRQMRFQGDVIAARKLVGSGQLGDIYYGRTNWLRSRGIPIGIGGWFLDKSKAGGGALIDLGVHALDNAWYVMGNPRPVSVSAQVCQAFGHLVPKDVLNTVDDSGFALIRFENGAALTIEITWAANMPEEIAAPGNGSVECLLFGSKAGLQLRPGGTLRVFQGKGSEVITKEITPAPADSFLLQMKNFLKAIRTGGQPENSADHALQLMQMLDAIYRSSETGREVRIRKQ